MKKPNILVFIRDFGNQFPKHQFKVDLIKSLEPYANMLYWHEDGNLGEILTRIDMEPDLILHYDIGWKQSYAPNIIGLRSRPCPLIAFVNDVHNPLHERIAYFDYAKPDLILSTYNKPFMQYFPQYVDKFV